VDISARYLSRGLRWSDLDDGFPSAKSL